MHGIRRRIFILNAITIIPIVLFVIYLNFTQYSRLKESTIDEIKNLAHIISIENSQVNEIARQLLVSISVVPEIQYSNNKCHQYLSNLLSKYKRYGNFGVTNTNGDLVCSAVTLTEKVNLSDRSFFKEAIRTKDFSIGEFVVSRSTGKSSINFGYPLLNQAGIAYATLNLDWLNDLVKNINTDENIVVTILDKKGVVLARTPDSDKLLGKEFPNDPLLKLLTDNEGVVETLGIDGKPRIYAYEKISNREGQEQYIIAGKNKSDISKEIQKDVIRSIIISIIIIVTSLMTGLVVGNSLITKTVNKLDEIEKLRKDFISLVSHQLRTPATSIKWFTEILLNDSKNKLASRQRRILKDTHISIKRMIELIGNVLNITKLENGKIELNKHGVDIEKMIKSIITSVNKEFVHKSIKHKLSSKTKYLICNVDEKLFYQAIYNLIHNAFKYSDHNGVVETSIEGNKSIMTIKVSDSGIGIPKAEKNNLFTKFSRATNAKMVDTEGAGLGLYLSKLIINAHKGGIKIANKKNGTLVLVTIPLI